MTHPTSRSTTKAIACTNSEN